MQKRLLLILSSYLIVGCSDGSSTKDNNLREAENTAVIEEVASDVNESRTLIKGRVVDGEISGAMIFLDFNRDGKLDKGEPSTKSDSKGYYELNVSQEVSEDYSVPLVAFGGEDIRLKSEFEEVLMAFRGEGDTKVNITPISTLIANDILEQIEKKSSENKRETKGVQDKLFKVTAEELFRLLEQTQKDFALLFNLDVKLITQDPVEVALEGNLELLKTNMKVNKVAREIKKAVKKELRDKTKDAIKSYRALSKALKEAQREAKKGDVILEEAVSLIAEVSPEVFDKDLIPTIKAITKYTLDAFDKSWEENKEGLFKPLKTKKSFWD
jgi:hypothetical protein